VKSTKPTYWAIRFVEGARSTRAYMLYVAARDFDWRGEQLWAPVRTATRCIVPLGPRKAFKAL
jgi:hypothetical protein